MKKGTSVSIFPPCHPSTKHNDLDCSIWSPQCHKATILLWVEGGVTKILVAKQVCFYISF